MKEICLKDIKLMQLEMLKKIDDFCQERGIKYFLSAGSLIGAVRHKGYIPWDDDIDIMMLRPDYNRFLREFNGSIPNLIVAAPELDWNYYAPFANVYDDRTVLEEGVNDHRGLVLGLKIDVFPYDSLPDNEFLYSIERIVSLFLNALLWEKRCKSKFSTLTLKRKIYRVTGSFFPYSFLQKCIHMIGVLHENKGTKDVFLKTFDIRKPMRASKLLFAKSIYVPFEQYEFPIPIGYDEFLKVRFGDYMKLPPVDQQEPHHGFKVFWKE